MKREARILVASSCGKGLLVAVVLRGPHRVEHVVPARGLEELASTLAASGVAEELRYAHPPGLAERIGAQPLTREELEGYMAGCSNCMEHVLEDLCSIVLSLH